MRFSQILSEREKDLYEAQKAALLQPTQKTNFGGAQPGYAGQTTTVNPAKLPPNKPKTQAPTATPGQGAYSQPGRTNQTGPSTQASPAAPGKIPNSTTAGAATQPAGSPATAAAAPGAPAATNTAAPNTTAAGTATPSAPAQSAGGATNSPNATVGAANQPASGSNQTANQPAPSGSKLQGFLKGAKTATDALGGAIRGTGNLASQTLGGIGQTAAAGIGGFQRGLAAGKQGQNFSAIAPTYNNGGSNSPSSADNIVAQQAGQAGVTPSSRAAGDSELADLRARLDSIENLLKSKP